MSFRFITKSIHAYLIDYPVAIALMVAPFPLNLGQSGPAALWLSVVSGVAALLLAALTDHPTGLVRIIPYWLISGWTAPWAWSSSLSPSPCISLGSTPGTTGFLPLRSC